MLKEYFAFGLKMLKQILPLAQLVLMFVPGGQLPAAAMRIFGALPDIIALIERNFEDLPGADKKAIAVSTAQALAAKMEGLTTGGASETWGKIAPAVGPAIDHIVGVINTYKEFSEMEASRKAVEAISP